MKIVKNAREVVEKINEFVTKNLSEDGKFQQEDGEIVSLIVSAVDKETTSMDVSASAYGIALTIFNLFQGMRTQEEKQAILLRLIAIERGINDMPEPPKPNANA